ncbi:hypothetical protein ACA910_005442 [Epithemia clementina (nom. ined.)]
MGGGGDWYYVPKVWSPGGGWWNNPANGPRNTNIAIGAIFIVSAIVFRISAELERSPIPPRVPGAPSQYYRVHAKEDDPRLDDYFKGKYKKPSGYE